MMSYCFANGCRNGSERVDDSVTFHPFPAHVEVADRWASLCGVTGEQRTRLIQDVERGSSGKYVICSLHFEDGAFERDPASPEGGPRDDECRLRQGAEPTLFLSSPLERQDTGLEHKAQVPDPEAAPRVSATEPGPSASPRTPETTVLNPQPGVSQIVLNFREQSHGLTLDNMPSESVTQCHGGCRSLQRVVKQIVLLFLDHPCGLVNQVSSSSSQDPPLILSSRTQTEGCRIPGVSHCPSSWPDAQEPLQPCPGPVETSDSSSHTDCPRRDEGLHHPQSHPDTQVPPRPCPGPVETSDSSSHTDCPRRDEGLHHPRSHPDTHFPPRPCPGPVLTSDPSNQGDGTRRCVEVNYRSPNLEIQISPELCLNTGRTDNSTTLSDGTDGQQQPVHSPISEPEKQTPLSRQEPAHTSSSCTQTEPTRRHDDQNPLPPTSDTRVHPKSFQSSSTQTEATRRHDGQNPLPPTSDTRVHPKSFQSSSTQTESPGEVPYGADHGIRHRSCMETILTLDSWTQTQPTDGHVPRQLRKCETGPESPPRAPLYNQPPCGSSCLASSLNQYVGNLLDCHKVLLQESVHHPCISPAPSIQFPCTLPQPRVRQIVLNFLDQESKPATQDVLVPGTPSHLSSPALTTHQHQETQTGEEEFQPLRTPQEKPKCRPRRPSKSHSCPPLSIGRVTSLGQQEENRPLTPISNELVSPLRGPQLSCDVVENKVTFDDVAVYFCKEEWELLGRDERGLYKEVMSDNYQSLVSLGFLLEKPKLMSLIEQEEEELWEDRTTGRRFSHQAEDNVCFADLGTDGVRFLENAETPSNTGRESVESSSHLGALMRLVNEIPGFLLGSSVTDGSSSPAHSLEDHESIRPCSVVKTEECSPACTPASVHAPRLLETPEIPASPGVPSNTEQSYSKVTVKVEEQVAVNHSSRHSAPFSHPGILPLYIKSDPGASTECVQGELQIKQEVPADVSPAHRFTGQHRPILPTKARTSHLPHGPETREPHTPDRGRRPLSRGGTSSWATLLPNRSMGTSPRNPSVSPASLSDRTNTAGLGDLKIKVKQEDSGSERDSAESPVCGRKVFNSPMSSPSVVRQLEREHWRLGYSPLRSPADNILLGSSPLHRLVNCLKEITAERPRAHNTTFSSARWGPDVNRICTEASVRQNDSRGSEIPAAKPNPFTVAVTNGSSRLRSRETWTPESRRPSRDEMQQSGVALSALGKCLDRSPARSSSGQNMGSSGFQRSEDPRRPELGVKRTHSDDLSRLPGVMSGAKRPTLEASSSSRAVSSCSPGRHDVWRPPEEPQRPPSVDQPIGKSHLMSVMDCVRRIPSCRPNPSIRGPTGPEADLSRTCTQSTGTQGKRIEVKKEKGPSPPLPASSQWLQPPDGPDQPGSSAKNVHLSGLMRLMEEIPRVESSNSSRAMYSIAVGHSVARRLDRSNYLSYCNDDGGFQAELNDNTIASVDSVFSDDTSWSSENVDPSYSAIGGLQRVVSEFAELGSISPLVAVSAPPASTSIQEGNGPKKPKEPVTTASVSRLSDGVRRTAGDAPGSAASACSAENGAVAYAALCGLQKVVHGFVEQECVSPISAVRNNPPNTGLRDFPGRKQMYQEEEAESPHLQGFSPAPTSRFLCDSGNWMSETDSSYSALSGLQKVVNGFSEMSCVSPFSAVSTTASEPPAQDSSYSTPSGLKKDVNGVPEAGCISPLTVASNLSSEGEPDPGGKRRCDRGDDNVTWKYSVDRQSQASNTASTHDDSGRSHDSYSSPQKTPGASSHCIDLTLEEEPLCGKSRTPTQEKQRRQMREGTELSGKRPVISSGNRSSGRVSGRQFIDLTEEDEESLIKPKVLNSGAARKSSHSDSPQKPSLTDAKHRPCIDLTQAQRVSAEKSTEPGPSGPSRGGVPVVNEHLSGLEKLLKGVPTFTQTSNASAQAWSGSWWFKSTSSHET
ncbi:uncharacterized protein LOC142159384 isoform X4 [Mixophyes fleayi]|uniref:uncharacterized protein LOC142159384 isoform X4 n=1 Tax=Mixophyes fleayi TaxID=3061075 RepID=UPI003F4DFA15